MISHIPKKVKGVLFDFDGVIARSMEDNYIAWKYAMDYFGIKIKRDDYFPNEGLTPLKVAETLFSIYNKQSSKKNYEKSIELKEHYYMKHHKFQFYPGVEYFVNKLKLKEISIGIVSGGAIKRLKSTVPKDFLDLFDAIITADYTEKGKPFPDPFLAGLDQLGLSREECVVIENAPLGIKSASTPK